MRINPISQNQQSFKALSIHGNVYEYPHLLKTLKTSNEIKAFSDTLHDAGYDVFAKIFDYESFKNQEWLRKIGFSLQVKKRVLHTESTGFKPQSLRFWDNFEESMDNFDYQKTLEKIKV